MNAKGFFFFKSQSEKGLNDVLEGGPWMIRKSPLFLNKWSTNVNVSKEDHICVPVWVKLHDVPISGFTEDGLSVIASRVGKPMLLDSYTSSMCVSAWGRPSYARTMIEVSAENDLKVKVIIATPSLDDAGGYTKDVVRVEYEWKPPRCTKCKTFGHSDTACPLIISAVNTKLVQKDDEGFEEVKKRNGKEVSKENKNKNGFPVGQQQRFIYRPVQQKKVDSGPRIINGFDNLINVDESGNILNGNSDGTVLGLKQNKSDGAENPISSADNDDTDVEPYNNETGKFMVNETEQFSEGVSTPGKKGDPV